MSKFAFNRKSSIFLNNCPPELDLVARCEVEELTVHVLVVLKGIVDGLFLVLVGQACLLVVLLIRVSRRISELDVCLVQALLLYFVRPNYSALSKGR